MIAVILLVSVSLTCHTDMVASTLATPQEECNDIIHVWRNGKCFSVCDDSSCGEYESCKCFQQLKFDCDGYSQFQYVSTSPGYWYDNNVSNYALNCPSVYCDLFQGWSNDSHPDRNEQCIPNWEGIGCGECKGSNSITFDTFKCVSSDECNKYGDYSWYGWPWLLVFLTTLLYWCIFILLVVVVLKFKFDTSIGYAYGLLFYYSVLENVVKQPVFDDYCYFDYSQCDSSDNEFYIFKFESILLSSLSSIGNLKPPYLQFMKFCLHTQVIDHVFFVYIHPLIVVCLLAIIVVAAKKSSKLTQLIRRHSNIMVCLIILLSYSSISYTSVQLLKPLVIYDRVTDKGNWHLYWSPSVPFANGWRILYVIIAVFCIVLISVGLPLLLLFEKTFASKLNLNLIRIKPILDQLQGCYKDEYRWFVAFYLICRQVIYICDLMFDFLPSSANVQKHTTILVITIIIMMIHVWFQPYKKKSLNVLDSAILMIFVFAIFASHSNNSMLRIVLWFLPLAIFLCYMTYLTKLKHIMIPIVCLGTLASCGLMLLPESDMEIVVLIIVLVSFYYLIKYIRETYKSCRQRHRAGYSQENNDDDYQQLYRRYKFMCSLLLKGILSMHVLCTENFRGKHFHVIIFLYD